MSLSQNRVLRKKWLLGSNRGASPLDETSACLLTVVSVGGLLSPRALSEKAQAQVGWALVLFVVCREEKSAGYIVMRSCLQLERHEDHHF